jgi:SAF domain
MRTSGVTRDRTASGAGPVPEPRPMPTAPRVPSPRARRRPGLLALGVALVAAGALTVAWLVTSAAQRVPVLVVARDVPYGTTLTAADLAVADVSVDPTVHTVPAAARDEVLGQVAAGHLAAGTLLGPDLLASAAPPGPGEVLVALALPAARIPAGSLQPSDRVLVVDTPPADADPPTSPPGSIAATVVRLAGPDIDGLTVVDVTVAAPDGPTLAARSATGRIAVVVQPRDTAR